MANINHSTHFRSMPCTATARPPKNIHRANQILGHFLQTTANQGPSSSHSLSNIRLLTAQAVAKHETPHKTSFPLHEAIINDDVDTVKKLLENGKCDINEPDDKGWTPLYWCYQRNNIDLFNFLLKEKKASLQMLEDGKRLLHEAAASSDSMLFVKSLLEANADCNEKCSEGLHPLDYAIESRNNDVIELLTKVGAKQSGENIEKFKNKLQLIILDIQNKKITEIANDLFNITPTSISAEKLVECIFQVSSYFTIPLLLDAFLLRNPQFNLSPLQKLHKLILEDKNQLLTNNSLFQMFKKLGIETSEENIQSCVDLAYRVRHPYIYRAAKSPVPPEDYMVNFLWVNLNPQNRDLDRAQNIFGDGLDLSENNKCIGDLEALRRLEETESLLSNEDLQTWKKVKKTFAYRISKWADLHPNARFNLWYDSALVTQTAQQKTFQMMQAIAKSRRVKLEMRDIRSIPNMEPEVAQSLHPGTPVYYRVDMLKILIADYFMRSPKEKAKYCIITDAYIGAMTAEQIFDQKTLDFLSSKGYVFNGNGIGGFENSFFIFNKEKKKLQQLHSKIMIGKMNSQLSQLREHSYLPSSFMLGSQSAYNNYHTFLN